MSTEIIGLGLSFVTALSLSAVYLKKSITTAVAGDVKKNVNIEALQKSFGEVQTRLEKQAEKTDLALQQMIRLETEMIDVKKNLDKTERDVKELTTKVVELKTVLN